ncbi:MAG TPA: acyl-CoA dehydratase activase-related protein [Coriobacteriia bacterium]|nr:acyl-CoA dehydratase activase-related protein [Coriobacteriia bacterium]
MRVGIPRGLLYAHHGAAWESVLSSLGVEALVSPPTNRAILAEGCRLAVDETCLSVKAYLGHVSWLAERSDAVLVPRVVSQSRRERECVKLWGIYDVVRNSLPDMNIIGYSVDAGGITQDASGYGRGLYELATSLGATPLSAATAVARARIAEWQTVAPGMARQRQVYSRPCEQPRVLLVGHAYNLHDEMIGAPIGRTLCELGCEVVDSEATPARLAKRLGRKASPGLQWSNNLRLLGSVQHWRDRVDGIVFVVTFPCGPDSLVTELALRKVRDVPMITLVLDEHSGEGGLRTRLESFVDILGMQRERKVLLKTAGEGGP